MSTANSAMEGLKKSYMANFTRPYYLIVFIIVIKLCATLTNGAIATSPITTKVNTTSKGTIPEKPSYNGKETTCPKLCVCGGGNGARETSTVTCRHVGMKLFPTIIRKDISSAPWRFAETLDLSENELSLLPGSGEEKTVIGSAIGIVIPSDNVTIMEVLGRNLRTIKLRGNLITAIEDNTFLLNPNLVTLNLERNRLTSISNRAFRGLTRLTTLSLKDNHLNHLSIDALKELPSLTTLDLTSNYFTEIPYAITELTTLEKLYMSKNKIATIPPSVLQKCPEISKFEIDRNPLQTVDYNAFIHLPKLKELIISGVRGVKTLPNLNGTVSLELLRFDRASIDTIPADLCDNCPNLKSLELKSNKIELIPELKECSELRML